MNLLEELLSGAHEDVALISPRGQVTYRELRSHAEAAAQALFRPGGKQLAFCFLPTTQDLVTAYLAAIAGGHAVALFPPATASHRKLRLIETYRPETVLAVGDELTDHLPGLCYQRIRWSVGDATTVWTTTASPVGGLHPDLALLLSTSGSTGTPKLVRLSAVNVAANAAGIAMSLRIGPGCRAVTSMPLYYSYGQSILSSHLMAGSSVLISDRSPVTPGFWRLVYEHNVVAVGGTPLVYRAIFGHGPDPGLPPTVRMMTQAGGRLPMPLIRSALAWMDKTAGQFFCMYGQTEATSRIAYLEAARLADKTGSVGTALPGGQIAVGPPAGGAPGGPISYTGPNVMMGYATCREDMARGSEVSTLQTGDLGRLDSDGFLYVTGRSSRFVKMLDRRVSLDDVEEWFGSAEHCAAVATPDDAVIVVFTTGQSPALEAQRRKLVLSLGTPSSAVVISTVAAIPLTAAGKVDYAQLSRLAAHLRGQP